MTRPAPQPGETPEPDGNPWASADPGAEWWRGDTAAHPVISPRGGGSTSTEQAHDDGTDDDTADDDTADDDTADTEADGDAAETGPARAAGATDVAEAAAAGRVAVPGVMGVDPAAVDEVPASGAAEDRYDEPTDDVLAGTTEPARITEPARTTEPLRITEPARTTEPLRAAQPVRITEPLRAAQPVRAAQPLRQRPVPSTASSSVRERVGSHQSTSQQSTSQQSTYRLEASPFWLGGDESAAAGPGAVPGRLGVPPRRVPPAPRRPAFGLVTLVLLAMVATFFAWVSAEPLWLAIGHGERGTATVTGCSGSGIGQRCRGDFTADGAPTTVAGVVLLGVAADRRTAGAVVPARMVNAESRRAYAAAGDLTLHLRWAVGVLIILLSGLVIAATTGARRLETARARRTAVLISIAGPLALLAGFLAVSY